MSHTQPKPKGRPWPVPLGLPGLRVAEVPDHCWTEVYCTDCDWTQSGKPGYHQIRASSIRHHLATHPGHTVEAKVRGIEQFTLDPAEGGPAAVTTGPREMPM